MIMATIPDRNNTITNEFMMLPAKEERGEGLSPHPGAVQGSIHTPEPLDVGVRHGLQDVVPPRCPANLLVFLHKS